MTVRAALALLVAAACGGGGGGGGGGAARIDTKPTAPPARATVPATRVARTPLHDAAQAGELATMRELLDRGADREAIEDVYHYTPLLLALEYSEPEAAMLLLDRGASTTGAVGIQALRLAARGGAAGVIDALLTRGVTARGTFALHAAAKYGHVAAIKRLLAAGEPVDEVEPADQWTPLLIACMENQPDVAGVLLAAGASVKVRDDDGNMPLHWAVFGARPEEIHEYPALGGPHDTYFIPQAGAPLVRALLRHGAPIDALDGGGDTALHRAVLYEALNAVDALLDAGANRALRNREGKTALEVARARGYADLVKRLEQP